MIVLKFGGTSVGTAESMKHVAKIVNTNEPKVVVLSAMSGTTNALVEIGKFLYKRYTHNAKEAIEKLKQNYYSVVKELFTEEEQQKKAENYVSSVFQQLSAMCDQPFSVFEEKVLLAQGELISTELFQLYLEEQNIDSALLPALEFMRIDKNGEPDDFYIQQNILRIIEENGKELFITQGYICRNAFGGVDNLQRGGSDYTASLLGAAIDANEIQIWTDIDGMHNNDPRFVDKTVPISALSFDEAAELAYFGAKILHPSSIRPAKDSNIPVRLKNTFNPIAEGTLISNESCSSSIKAIAAKDGIIAIKIKSGRMLMAYGFLRKVFEVFERYKTPIDMISTSEVAISLTIDDDRNLSQIIEDLSAYGTVDIDKNLSIVCVVGDLLSDTKGQVVKILETLKDIPVRMVSYGGSDNNISLTVKTEDKVPALVEMNRRLFNL